MTLQELTAQAIALSPEDRQTLIKSVQQSLQALSQEDAWPHLWLYPHTWRKQLYMKGRKLPASVVWHSMLANEMTPEDTAHDWDLSVESVYEAIRYCETHRELLEQEAEIDRNAAIDGSTVSRKSL